MDWCGHGESNRRPFYFIRYVSEAGKQIPSGQEIYVAIERLNCNNSFGHPPEAAISRKVLLVKNLEKRTYHVPTACELCLENKSKRDRRNIADKLISGTRKTLKLVHSDLCGPIGIHLVGKARYFVTLYDDAFSVSAVWFVQTEDQIEIALSERSSQWNLVQWTARTFVG